MLTVLDLGIQKADANSNLQEHMVQRGNMDKGWMEGERTGAQNKYVPCHHVYRPCEAQRKDVMPED